MPPHPRPAGRAQPSRPAASAARSSLPVRGVLATWAACTLAGSALAVQETEEAGEPELLPYPDPLAVPRIPEDLARPRIDGRLDEAVWARAAVIDDLRQVVPVAGADPTEATKIFLLRGEDALYIGLACYDRDPAEIRATQMERDANLDPDDRIELILDTFNDRRNAFWFQVGPAGGPGDALLAGDGTSFNKDWDGIWTTASTIGEDGWFAELELPYKTLAFDPENGTWGFNVRRFIRRRNEEARWSRPDPKYRFFSASQAGTITGLAGLDQGLGLDVVPFATSTVSWEQGVPEDGTVDDTDLLGDGGLDVFWRIDPQTRLSLSFNTDFAEAEVDDRQVNLGRFSLFFPERRDFFLDDSNLFEFGNNGRGPRPVRPFFSRTIGLDADREEVPILAAAKFTRRTDGYSVGLLNVQTDDAGDLDGTNLFVGRASAFFGDRSDAGVLLTSGNPSGAGEALTYGADLNLRTASLFGDKNLEWTNYLTGTRNDADEESDGDGEAWFSQLNYPNDEITARVTYASVGEDYDPQLGFVSREAIRRFDTRFEYRPRQYTDVRNLRYQLSSSWFTDQDGNTETQNLTFIPFGMVFETGDQFNIVAQRNREVLAESFEILDGVEIPEGDYPFWRYGFNAETAEFREVSAELEVRLGEFYDGCRDDVGVEIQWRPSAKFNLGLEYDRRDLRLAGGDETVHIGSMRALFVFTPQLSWSNLLQYDNQSENLGLNSRVRWIIEPGKELFAVVNQSWVADSNNFSAGDGQLILKL
ncbi:MAG: carbohydrate binding family 9 domain-containing protein, partial [Planctomycetota bacterium]